MSKKYKPKSEAVEESDVVETPAEALPEAPASPVNAWRLRPLGSGGEYREIVGDTLEDAIRAFNAAGVGGVVYPAKRLEIIRPAVSEVL